MNILITERPSGNAYIESLMNAYSQAGNMVSCDASNFFHSNQPQDILHIHWPERLYKWSPPVGIKESDIIKVIEERLLWHKNKGATILNTIHNLQPHDSNLEIGKQAYRLIIKHADILVHHCEASITLLADTYPEASEKTNIVCRHGDYLIHHKNINQAIARSEYNIPEDKVVILNFGQQRPYKNENLITAAVKKLDIGSKYLVIAGRFKYPDDNLMKFLFFRARNKVRNTLKYHNKKYLYRGFSTLDLPGIISCADIIFLGQKYALNSGLLPLAATFGKPVVCPDTGCFREAISEWCHEIYKPGDIESATNALQLMCERIPELRKESRSLDNSTWLSENSWEKHVTKILSHIPSDGCGDSG